MDEPCRLDDAAMCFLCHHFLPNLFSLLFNPPIEQFSKHIYRQTSLPLQMDASACQMFASFIIQNLEHL